MISGATQELLLNRRTKDLLGTPVDPAALKSGREKAKLLIAEARRKAAAKRSAGVSAAVTRMRSRRAAVKQRLQDLVSVRHKRTPEAIIGSFVKRLTLPAQARKQPNIPAALIIRSTKTDVHAFTESLAKILGAGNPVDLNAVGITVRKIAMGKGPGASFSVRFPVASRSVRTELLNLAWALRRTEAFSSVAVNGLRGVLCTVAPTAATRAERNFGWHLDLTRTRAAQMLAPGSATGSRLGEGIVIAHPDTGWAPHKQYNRDFIDEARSHNVITGATGGNAARHSRQNKDAEAFNITHGTATGSVILGGDAGDGEELSSTRSESALAFSTFPDGTRMHIGRSVHDARGHLAGVAPKATVLPIKFISDEALAEIPERGLEGIGVFRLFDEDLVSAIRYAIDNETHVVSLSAGGLMHDEVRQVMDEAILEHDIIVVAAVGQTYAANIVSSVGEAGAALGLVADDSVILPAAYANVIAVAGCAPSGAPWSESHRGPNVDITAPADAVWIADFDPKDDDRAGAAIREQRLECASGTSFAASFLAGVAALWLSHWGRQALIDRYRPAGIALAWVFRHQLQRTSDAAHADDWDTTRYGPGVPNVERLLLRSLPDPADVEPPPAMVNGLVPGVSAGLESGYDTFLEFLDWGADRIDQGKAAVAGGIVITQKAVEDGLNALGNAWATVDAAARGFVGDALNEAQNLKTGLEQGVTELIETGEEFAEDTAEAAGDAWEEAGEAVGEFVDNVGEAGEDVADAVFGWLPT